MNHMINARTSMRRQKVVVLVVGLLAMALGVFGVLTPIAYAMPDPSSSVTITGSPPSVVTGTSQVTFSFVGVNHHPTAPGYWCNLDRSLAPTPGTSWTFCSSPWTVTVPTDGNWRFTVAMPAPDVDGPGIVDYVYAWHDFVVANNPPAIQFTDVPATVSSLTNPTFAFVVDGAGATATCQLDTSAPLACWGSFSVSNLAPGSHTLTVVASNPAGSTQATYSWTVQPTTTRPTVDATFPNGVSGSQVTIVWSTTGVVDRTECMLDENGRWFRCSSPYELTALADGEHMFSIRVSNGAGTDQADGSWWVDHTITSQPPSVTVTSKPATKTTATTATFVYALTNAVQARCTLDGVAVGCTTTRLRVTGLTVGTHRVTITPVGANGAAGQEWSYNWAVAPSLVISSRPANGNVGDATFVFTTTPGASVVCKLDRSAAVPCISPWVLPSASLPPGTHRVVLTASLNGQVTTKAVSWTQG